MVARCERHKGATGLGIITQDQINRAMAAKVAADRAQDNANLTELYNIQLDNWRLNGGRGPEPVLPPLYETDPNKLHQFFNSGQVGVLTTAGVSQYDPGMVIIGGQNYGGGVNAQTGDWSGGAIVHTSGGWSPAYTQNSGNQQNTNVNRPNAVNPPSGGGASTVVGVANQTNQMGSNPVSTLIPAGLPSWAIPAAIGLLLFILKR